MKTLTKSVLILLTASSLATSAFAKEHSDSEIIAEQKAAISLLSSKLEALGVNVNSTVTFKGDHSPYSKEQAYNAKLEELKTDFYNAKGKL